MLVKNSRGDQGSHLFFPVFIITTAIDTLGSLRPATRWVPAVQEVIRSSTLREESFYVYSHAEVKKTYKLWNTLLPKITPYYAVKCNHDNTLLTSLAHLGCRFDCASPSEIERVLALNVPAANVIYANPCKRVRDLLYAQACGVSLTTLDSYGEIDKVANACSEGGMSVLLRIFASDPTAKCVLSNKFGAAKSEWARMLAHMKERNLECKGISFHVGSGACNPAAFSAAIASAAEAFQAARNAGHTPTILDIGGGFSLANLEIIAPTVNEAIQEHFAVEDANNELEIIAEPGRLFAEHSAAFVVQVIGVRETLVGTKRQYWVTDGLYGSFNCVLYDHATVNKPIVLTEEGDEADGALEHSDIFGPTCDGLDTIASDIFLPRAEVGDWMLFGDMGAYTIAGATTFNGILFNQVRTFDA